MPLKTKIPQFYYLFTLNINPLRSAGRIKSLSRCLFCCRKATVRKVTTIWWWTSPTRYRGVLRAGVLHYRGRRKIKISRLVKLPQDPSSPKGSPAHSPRENGLDKRRLLKKDAPLSPSSIASSSSTPSSKSKEISLVSHTG